MLGTLAGDFVFMVAAVAALAAIMQSNPVVFQALQWFGAGYLVWMGVQLAARQHGQHRCRGRAAALAAVYSDRPSR